jgi:hypothetical protein
MSAKKGWLMQSMAVALSDGSKASMGINQSENSENLIARNQQSMLSNICRSSPAEPKTVFRSMEDDLNGR